jgi:alanine dehydrogenase
MIIGILKETKTPPDSRVPLTPIQCRQIEDEFPGIRVFVQPSNDRCYSDHAYEMEGIHLTNDLSGCDVLMGVKEVKPDLLLSGKTYFFFSHTIKKQPYNKMLLRTVLDKGIRLVDYETLTDGNGIRIIGFGRWAGLVGTYNGLRAWCLRTGIASLVPPETCDGLNVMMKQARNVNLPPLKIALTGDGRVAGGAEEMLGAFGIQKITVEEYLETDPIDRAVYAQLDPSKYNVHKAGIPFNLSDFFIHPEAYASNFSRFLSKTDVLIMAAYWDPKAPVLFTPDEMKSMDFRIRVIADITCDMRGSVPSSIRTTTFDAPFYDYNPATGNEEPAFTNPRHVTVMTIDNLPCGLPREASMDFGYHLMKSVLPLLQGGDSEEIIGRATIAENGKLTSRYAYLGEWVNQH